MGVVSLHFFQVLGAYDFGLPSHDATHVLHFLQFDDVLISFLLFFFLLLLILLPQLLGDLVVVLHHLHP